MALRSTQVSLDERRAILRVITGFNAERRSKGERTVRYFNEGRYVRIKGDFPAPLRERLVAANLPVPEVYNATTQGLYGDYYNQPGWSWVCKDYEQTRRIGRDGNGYRIWIRITN